MDEMAEPRGLRGYLAGQNDGPGGVTNAERAAFLSGEGTLPYAEIVRWSVELGGSPPPPDYVLSTDPMMVSVVRGAGR
jgi:hypothetical protein